MCETVYGPFPRQQGAQRRHQQGAKKGLISSNVGKPGNRKLLFTLITRTVLRVNARNSRRTDYVHVPTGFMRIF